MTPSAKAYFAPAPLRRVVSEAAAHPPPPGAQAAPAEEDPGGTSERVFRQRLVKDLTSFNLKDLRAMWHEDLFEPHMHLFVLLVAAFAVGILIWIVEPRLL